MAIDPKVSPLFAPEQPVEADPGPSGVAILRTLLNVAAARSLALLAVLGAVAIWGYAAYDPQVLRLYAGAGYSVGVLIPILYLYWKS
ncbi:MAG: hypothetical protein KGL39_12480 [Patescibacteria group bacterium]|nr:hypothetical protein [Patescibacteria group bacterium]